MKYFWFIFSIFIFFLATAPCCDEGKQDEYTHTAMTEIQNHEHGSHSGQVCSPFCACACCGTHGCNAQPFQASVIVPSFVQQPATIKINNYVFQFVSKFETSIWQPPKIG